MDLLIQRKEEKVGTGSDLGKLYNLNVFTLSVCGHSLPFIYKITIF